MEGTEMSDELSIADGAEIERTARILAAAAILKHADEIDSRIRTNSKTLTPDDKGKTYLHPNSEAYLVRSIKADQLLQKELRSIAHNIVSPEPSHD